MSLILGFAARLIGGHLVKAFAERTATGALFTAEHLIVGLGFRFFLGLGSALYFTDDGVRAAVNAAAKAIAHVVV